MSWGIDFYTNVFISRQNFGSSHEVAAKIEELEEELEIIKDKFLIMSAASDFTKFYGDSDDKPFNLRDEVSDLLDWYSRNVRLITKLKLYKEYLENKGE
jgi:hypothetical protein